MSRFSVSVSSTMIAALIVILATSACVSILPKTAPPAPRYAIAPVSAGSLKGDRVSWALVIADPTTSQLYNTTKIALTHDHNRFEFFAGAEWADRAPVLLQHALVRSFENSGRILRIGDFTALPVSDYVLKMDIRAFHVDYTSGQPEIIISIYSRLVDKAGKIQAVQLFNSREVVSADAVSVIMTSFDSALNRVLGEIVAWGFAKGIALTAAPVVDKPEPRE